MKKTLLMIVFLSAVLSFTGCGNLGEIVKGIVDEAGQNSEDDVDSKEESEEQEKVDKVNRLIEQGRTALFGLDGAEVNYDKAMEYFQEAASEDVEDVAEANYYIGHMYDYGYGVLRDFETAYEYFLLAEEYDNAKAQYAIGYLYYNGQHVEEDKNLAKEYFEEAISNGFVEAKEGLAAIAYDEGDYGLAETLVLEVIEEGNEPDIVAGAMLDLADLYTNEETGMLDYEAALEWTKKAVELKYPYAYNNMGILYHYGYGVEEDRVQALEWYEKAAECGCPVAYSNLGNAYRYGYGVEFDPYKAAEYYEEAGNRQYASAMYKLGIMHYGETIEENGKEYVVTVKDFEGDYEVAFYWFEKAANLGNDKAMLHLGEMYSVGDFVEQDASRALEWYEKAAELGNVIALNKAGMMYYRGDSVDVDYEKAFELIKKGAEGGSSRATLNVAMLYYNGQGVEKDYDKAIEWAQKALEMGHEKAQELIDSIEDER